MLQSMRLQRVGYDRETEQRVKKKQMNEILCPKDNHNLVFSGERKRYENT